MEKPEQQDPFGTTTLQTELARIKKEKSEEIWISEEELYTDGSSDEEECGNELRLRSELNDNQSATSPSVNSKAQENHSAASNEVKTELDKVSNASDDHFLVKEQHPANLRNVGGIHKTFLSTASTDSQPPPPPPTPTEVNSAEHVGDNSDGYSSDEEDETDPNDTPRKQKRGTNAPPNCSVTVSEQFEKC